LSGVALVTGASDGIGRALALEAARRGYSVVVHFNNNSRGADETIRVITSSLPNSVTALCRCDLAAPEPDVQSIRSIVDGLGEMSLLINNAGATFSGPLKDVTPELWAGGVALNLGAPLWLSREFAPDLARNNGAIINIASVAGLIGSTHSAIYGATKAGLIGLTKSLAQELAPNIRVNVVCPGAIDTPILEVLGAEKLDGIAKSTPLGRIGIPADVAPVVLDIASWSHCTGQTVVIDGGKLMH
jgi:NAD(P)-dependent dehydrogenase (short-subunit alcohol dehydrogenase family)